MSKSNNAFIMGCCLIAVTLGVGLITQQQEEYIDDGAVLQQAEQAAEEVSVQYNYEQPNPALEIAILRAQEFEGFSSTPYLLDGVWHIGYGRTGGVDPDHPSISMAEADVFLNEDMRAVEEELVGSLWFYHELPLEARVVLLDMGYNMGVPRLLGFHYMLNGMRVQDWSTVTIELVDSVYYDQVTRRANSNIMLIVDLMGQIEGRGNL